MSEDFFDDKIRKKLESMRPEYSEAAWQKLKRSLPVPWYVSFLKDFGSWIFGGLATVAFLATYNVNQNIKKENELLNDKISTIIKTTGSKTTTDTFYVHQSDTVYLTRYITKYIKPAESLESSENEELASKLTSKSNKALKSESSFISSKTEKTSVLANNDKSILKEANLPKNNSRISDLPSQTINEDKVVAMVSDEKLNTPKTEEKNLVTEDKIAAIVPEDSIKTKAEKPLVDELIIPEKKIIDPLEQKAAKFSLKNINARFGISGDYMGEHFRSLGPAIEIFMGERFGFNTGVLITGKNQFEYLLPRDFNMGTGKRFEDRYQNFIGPKPSRIEDIHIQTSSVKVPLYFNYYIPVKNNLSFMVTTGTKLDVAVIESVSYTGQDVLGSPYLSTFESQYKPKVFNNLFYGMGVQYQYKRIAGQFSPYFEFPFGQASYLVSPKKFGLNASLKFNLHK